MYPSARASCLRKKRVRGASIRAFQPQYASHVIRVVPRVRNLGMHFNQQGNNKSCMQALLESGRKACF